MLTCRSNYQKALDSITLIVDTREQMTSKLKKRLKEVGYPVERRKLDFGDYSAKVIFKEEEISFEDEFAIERKMNLDELASCFGKSRDRFTREFERAKAKQGKLYLLVEQASFEKIFDGYYRSQMLPNALIASIMAFLSRYNCQLLFCEPSSTGKLIKEIIKREVNERLKAMSDEEGEQDV